jgi:hypothetical protein
MLLRCISGVKYQGEWKDGNKVGKGVVMFKDENGKLITEVYTDGLRDIDIEYDGPFTTSAAELPDVKLLAA